MVNGANVVEGKNNGAAIVPNLDSIEEFRIITNNFDAEYGNYSGGQINVATKSGKNTFHGSAFEFLRNTDFDARNFLNHGPGTTKEDFKQNQFGGTIGGPIKRDRLFFFVDYQGTRQIRGNVVTTGAPSSDVFPDSAGNVNALSLFDGAYAANGSCGAATCADGLAASGGAGFTGGSTGGGSGSIIAGGAGTTMPAPAAYAASRASTSDTYVVDGL
jgi:hypothetical protein